MTFPPEEPSTPGLEQSSGDESDDRVELITPASPPTDPSILETREFQFQGEPDSQPTRHFTPREEPPAQHVSSSVPPETGNRTLWIILGIIAAIVLICCCILPLGLLAVANMDAALQDEIRSSLFLTYL